MDTPHKTKTDVHSPSSKSDRSTRIAQLRAKKQKIVQETLGNDMQQKLSEREEIQLKLTERRRKREEKLKEELEIMELEKLSLEEELLEVKLKLVDVEALNDDNLENLSADMELRLKEYENELSDMKEMIKLNKEMDRLQENEIDTLNQELFDQKALLEEISKESKVHQQQVQEKEEQLKLYQEREKLKVSTQSDEEVHRMKLEIAMIEFDLQLSQISNNELSKLSNDIQSYLPDEIVRVDIQSGQSTILLKIIESKLSLMTETIETWYLQCQPSYYAFLIIYLKVTGYLANKIRCGIVSKPQYLKLGYFLNDLREFETSLHEITKKMKIDKLCVDASFSPLLTMWKIISKIYLDINPEQSTWVGLRSLFSVLASVNEFAKSNHEELLKRLNQDDEFVLHMDQKIRNVSKLISKTIQYLDKFDDETVVSNQEIEKDVAKLAFVASKLIVLLQKEFQPVIQDWNSNFKWTRNVFRDMCKLSFKLHPSVQLFHLSESIVSSFYDAITIFKYLLPFIEEDESLEIDLDSVYEGLIEQIAKINEAVLQSLESPRVQYQNVALIERKHEIQHKLSSVSELVEKDLANQEKIGQLQEEKTKLEGEMYKLQLKIATLEKEVQQIDRSKTLVKEHQYQIQKLQECKSQIDDLQRNQNVYKEAIQKLRTENELLQKQKQNFSKSQMEDKPIASTFDIVAHDAISSSLVVLISNQQRLRRNRYSQELAKILETTQKKKFSQRKRKIEKIIQQKFLQIREKELQLRTSITVIDITKPKAKEMYQKNRIFETELRNNIKSIMHDLNVQLDKFQIIL